MTRTVFDVIGTSNRESNQQLTVAYNGKETGPVKTTWTRVVNTNIVAQISGLATDVTAVLERSDVDPSSSKYNDNAVPMDSGISGVDLTTTPQAPFIYYEYGQAWYRWNVSAATTTGEQSFNLSIQYLSD